MIHAGLDLSQYAEADRREVNPAIEAEAATWAAAGQLDWWVRERREWFGRVCVPDGRLRWIKAVDLRLKEGSERRLTGP
jgi:hypothetical protein